MKTLPILKNDFDEALVALVNNCGLPACVIRPSVANLLQILTQMEAKELAEAKAEAEKGNEE